MRFLVDANLSPRVAARLRAAGHEVAHVGNLPTVEVDLESGAVVTIGRGHLRVRPLPMRRGD